jgi:hypothetical protein
MQLILPPESCPSFFDFDVTKVMADFRFRPIDVEALMACRGRNIEALSHANQLAVEGMQAIATRHIEIARQAVEDVSALLRHLAQPASPEDRVTAVATRCVAGDRQAEANTPG